MSDPDKIRLDLYSWCSKFKISNTPEAPLAIKPYIADLPTLTMSAPSVIAFRMSVPDLTPPSKKIIVFFFLIFF